MEVSHIYNNKYLDFWPILQLVALSKSNDGTYSVHQVWRFTEPYSIII